MNNDTRDDRILRHVGLYRLSLRAVLEELFFEGKTCDHVVQRLLQAERLQAFSGLPGGLSYYQLTLPEARRLGFPDDRTRPHNPAALQRALSILWYCCMSGRQRRRLERRNLTQLFGSHQPGCGLPHAIEMFENERFAIRRIYTPGPAASVHRFVKKVRRHADHALSSPTMAKWADAGSYSFVVLCEAGAKRDRYEEQLRRYRTKVPLVFSVDCVPGPLTLAEALRARMEGAA